MLLHRSLCSAAGTWLDEDDREQITLTLQQQPNKEVTNRFLDKTEAGCSEGDCKYEPFFHTLSVTKWK